VVLEGVVVLVFGFPARPAGRHDRRYGLVGEVMIGDKRVDLKNVTMPVLNLYADKDHLVPPASSLALEKYIGASDYTAQGFPVGHIGMYVSGKVQRDLPPTIVNWLKTRV
jgi:polyhydroxyalkanoate synthase